MLNTIFELDKYDLELETKLAEYYEYEVKICIKSLISNFHTILEFFQHFVII